MVRGNRTSVVAPPGRPGWAGTQPGGNIGLGVRVGARVATLDPGNEPGEVGVPGDLVPVA